MENNIEEIWKDIEGYEGLYQISNLGRVKSLPKIIKSNYFRGEKILKFDLIPVGYYQVSLYKNKERKKEMIHRLVAKTFISNPENKAQVNHKDADKLNNCVENLEWATNQENRNHACKMGIISRGEKVSILKENEIKEIRRLYDSNKYTLKDLATKFGVGFQNISCIVNRKTWKHI